MSGNGRKVLAKLTTTIAVAGMVLGSIGDLSWAATALRNGQSVDGFIRSNSPAFKFRNQARPGAPTQSARGQEFTFAAQAGNNVTLTIDVEDGSSLKPTLVLLAPNGQQVAYDETRGVLRYRVPTAGNYRLLVLARNNTLGRYEVSVVGLTTPATTGTPGTTSTQVAQADQVMQDVLKLRIIGCGVPNVARIQIGNEERCTRDIEPGRYVYDQTTSSLKVVDTRRELLAQRLQLTVLERCPSTGTPTVVILMRDPQDSKDYTYCATPSRFVKAGTYRYDSATDELTPTTVATQPTTPTTTTPTTTTPTTTTPTTTTASAADPRRQLLQTEYGLQVLDGCPASRSSLVVVTFPDAANNQDYVYCANPNRLITAGEYVYNTQNDKLEAARQPAPACTVSIGGICIVQ